MAYESTEFILKEGMIDYGTIASPDAIDPSTDPNDSFSLTDNVGYIRMGTINMNMPDERVEYLSNTPHIRIRNDLLMRDWFWEFTVNQFNITALALFKNTLTESGAYNLMHVGPDQAIATRYCFRLRSFRVDGTAFNAFIYSGEVATEDNSITPSGSDYVDIPVRILAYPHADFDISDATDLQKAYGLVWYPAPS